ncbi:MAG: hypothetical protein IPK80_24005 [Nannocystis sp.]|jgi:hypothetical protein|nr:hypothetical protein [Nannocystis sp.]
MGEESDEPRAGSPLPAAFSMRFSPSNQLISIVRRFVLAFYGRVLGDNETSGLLALATHELLENAVKYGINDEASLAVEVRGAAPTLEIVVTLRNQARAEHAAAAMAMIEALRGCEDPFSFYQALMIEAAGRQQGSGLGLARIRVETGMTLEMKIEGATVEISAHMRYEPGRSG